MNKQKCEELIDRLADKTLSFGCDVEFDEHKITIANHKADKRIVSKKVVDTIIWRNEEWFIDKILGHPIMIGDVLEKLKGDIPLVDLLDKKTPAQVKLMVLWENCGFNKSLQQIKDNSGFVINSCYKGKHGIKGKTCKGEHPNCKPFEKLKDKNANNLFEFLNKIL